MSDQMSARIVMRVTCLLLVLISLSTVSAGENDQSPYYLLTMESKAEVELYGDDETGCSFTLAKEPLFQGNNSVKVTPNGKSLITKVTLPLFGEENLTQWKLAQKIALNVHFSADSLVIPSEFYLGLVDVTEDRLVIQTVKLDQNATGAIKSGWNTLVFDIDEQFMKEISVDRKYALFISFVGAKDGVRVPLEDSFHLDGAYLIMPPKQIKSEYLWRMETADEIAKYSNDNTGAQFELSADYTIEGDFSCKVIPSGDAIETKIALDLTSPRVNQWNGHRELIINFYIPDDCELNTFFLGMGDSNDGWSWVDGVQSDHIATKGWNEVHYTLSDKMRYVIHNGKYNLYIICWATDPDGRKLPITKPFYIDGVKLDKIDYLWEMESEDEIGKFTNDNTGAVFMLNADIVFQGDFSCQVIPSGNAIETKVALDLTGERTTLWNNHNELVINFYIPEDCELTDFFLGMADSNEGWSWIDGIASPQKAVKGWNEVHYPLSPPMKEVIENGFYNLYIICWATDQDGLKIPITKPFYIDGIYMAD
jgi:hypothetical protein